MVPFATRAKMACKMVTSRLLLLRKLILRSPHVLVVPIVVFGLMVGLGTYGVITSRHDETDKARSTAAVDADSASQALQLAIQRAVLPLNQITEIVKILPEKQPLEKQWLLNAPSWWLGAAAGTLFLSISPLGVTSQAHPPNGTLSSKSIGLSLLTTPNIRPSILAVLEQKAMSMQGPAMVAAGTVYLCTIQQPIYISNMTEDQTWGYTFNSSSCPPGLCWDPATKTKWWGFASLGLDAGVFLGSNGPLSILNRKGYKFQLWHPPVAGVQASISDSGMVPVFASMGSNGSDSSVIVQVPVVNQMWELHVWKDSWAPTWMLPLIVVVVLGALIVSALLFSTLSSWEEHRALLHSLLPKETIARMRHEAKWAAAEGDDDIKTVRLETPAELMLRIIDDCVAGRSPAVSMLLNVKEALQRSADVYRPSEQQMKQQMNDLADLDDEVRKALVNQLLGAYGSVHPRMSQTIEGGDYTRENTDAMDEATNPNSTSTSKSLALRASILESMNQADEDMADVVLKAVRFASCTGVSNGPAIAKLMTSSRSKLATQAAACSAFMQSSGFSEEVGITLASWMLQTPQLARSISLAELSGVVTSTKAGNTPGSTMPKCGSGFENTAGSSHVALLVAPVMDKPEAGKCPLVDLGPYARASAHPKCTRSDGGDDASHNGANDESFQPDEPVMSVMRPVLTRLEQVLVSADDWSFDAYALEEASHGRPLSCLGFWLLHSTGLKDWAHMSTKRLIRFLERVEEGYADNPYHNRRHAADVLQSVHVLMHKSGLVPGFADQLTMLGCYLAAIVHDFEHVGRTNDFLVNSSDHLAVRYNDRSPMENHHLAAAWSLLKTRDCSILSGLSRSEVAKLRKLVIDLVLATDMKQHFAIVGQFETLKRQSENDLSSTPTSDGESTDGPVTVSAMEGHGKLRPLSEQDLLLSLQMMLKCADLGHLTAPLQVHLKWVAALEAEFFLQGDLEKAMGISISPLCDRTKEGVTKSQTGFFDFVVLPLFKTFTQRFTGASPMLHAVQNNHTHWKAVAAHQIIKDT